MIFKKVDHPTHPKATTGERKKTVVVKEPIKKKEISKNITKSYASGSTESTGEVRKCYHNGFK